MANEAAETHRQNCGMEDEDLHKHMAREEMEDLMGPFIVDFKKCLEDALAASGKLFYNFISSFANQSGGHLFLVLYHMQASCLH